MPRFEDRLRGLKVKDVSQIELDRVVLITVEGGGKLYRLYFELIPPFPNLYLTDEKDIVLAVLFRAGTRTRHRIIEKRKTYTPPAAQERIHPVDVTEKDFESIDLERDPAALSRRILGIGPLLSREIATRGAKSGSAYKAFEAMLDDYRKARPAAYLSGMAPTIIKSPPYLAVTWYKPSIDDVASIEKVESLNAAIATVIAEFLSTSKLEHMRASVHRHLAREIRRARKALARTGVAGEHEKDSAAYRKYGETILANLGNMKKGAFSARLPDIHSTGGEKIRIPLEAKLSPQANAEVYFAKARKSTRRAERARQKLDEMHSRLTELIRLEEMAAAPEITRARLAEIAGAISRPRHAAGEDKEPVDEKAVRLGIRPRRFTVTGGWTVLVGRSARENDVLSHRYASPGDLWFHARQAQGSHVVLRRGKKKAEVPKQAILEAAAIAAHYSKARTSKHVAVSYTEKRYVKKVRKGPPGTAAMLREKVVFVDPATP
jgi:predicted ribosome quality control (RQC) complex YloA/Tae2 family protein